MRELCDDVKNKINLYLPYKCHICNVKINIFDNKIKYIKSRHTTFYFCTNNCYLFN